MEKSLFKLILLVFLAGISAKAQDKSVFGKVLDPATQKAIENINIINKRSKEVVATNASGDFYIRANVGDSILISTYGYERKGLVFDGIHKQVTLYVKQQPIMLREVVVTDKRLVDLHKEINDFMDNPYNSKSIRNEILKSMLNTHVSSPGGGIGISIDALYDMFSKDGKDKRKLADIQYGAAKEFYKNLRYNPQIVAQITHLQNDELEDFMTFCKPNDEFILRSTDYELTFKILRCLGDFNRSKVFRKIR